MVRKSEEIKRYAKSIIIKDICCGNTPEIWMNEIQKEYKITLLLFYRR